MTRPVPATANRVLRHAIQLTLVSALFANPVVAAETDQSVQTLPRVKVQGEAEDVPYAVGSTSSATRTDTPLRDVPQAITVLDEDAIADQGMRGMADVVRYVPGITMGQGEGNRDQATIRGNGTTADFFVNGVRDDTQYFRDLYNIERVEALKGPNAMIFGRGGGGGVINRVTKQAEWRAIREFTVQGGSYDDFRGTLDIGQNINDAVAFRVNGVYEDSESYRDDVELERYGINPTLGIAFGDNTLLQLSYEHFSDERTADRGIPSFQGKPLDVDESTFFGDPSLSRSDIEANTLSALLEHRTENGLLIRNRAHYAQYDKFYQNVFPGAVNPAGTEVNIAAYNNGTERKNLFNQTDVVFTVDGGALEHTLVVGAEIGRQETDNLRNTGYFFDVGTGLTTPLSSPTVSVPITFRQSATDANNHVEADIAAVYLQDQIALSEQWQAIVGLRYDTFDLKLRNNRTGERLDRDDDFVSPRAGLVYNPIEPVSLYASYSVSFLPSSGDQFASLNATTETLEPEEFENIEVGAKWDVAEALSFTAAVFQLDRENTSAPDPTTPGRIVQTGSQRSRGVELGINGSILPGWSIMGGYAYQDAEITRRTNAADEGAVVPYTPEHTISLWNRYDFTPRIGAGVGLIYQDELYASIDNSVTLPDFTRVDLAVFARITDTLRAQLNVENVFDEEYYPTAHNNNNITPGAPTNFRLSLIGNF